MKRHIAAAALLTAAIASTPAFAARYHAGPYPPYPPYPPPPARPVQVIDPTPPPLSPVMRVVYAPFYAAGLVLRYGVYYVLIAPIEVLTRTAAYGVEGGVERRPPETAPPVPGDRP